MATSGTTTFNMTRSEIIARSLRIIGALDQNASSPTAQQSTQANEVLNVLVKTLQNEGVRLWTRNWITQTLTASSKVTGSDGNYYRCINSHTSSTDDEPITGGNYRTYWYLTDSTNGAWADTTAYTSIATFNLNSGYIGYDKAFVRDENSNDCELNIISMEKYLEIPDKHSLGTPTHIALDDRYPTLKSYIWPIPDSATDYIINLFAIKLLEDFTSNSDNPDFPVRWLNVLIYGLAFHLSHDYGLPLSERGYIEKMYEKAKADAKANDKTTSAHFVNPCY